MLARGTASLTRIAGDLLCHIHSRDPHVQWVERMQQFLGGFIHGLQSETEAGSGESQTHG